MNRPGIRTVVAACSCAFAVATPLTVPAWDDATAPAPAPLSRPAAGASQLATPAPAGQGPAGLRLNNSNGNAVNDPTNGNARMGASTNDRTTATQRPHPPRNDAARTGPAQPP